MKRAAMMALAGLGWMAGAQMMAQTAPVEHTATMELQKAPEIPADQQPTKDQLDKLFEVMRVKEQLAATTRMVPQLIRQSFDEELNELKKDNPRMSSLNGEQTRAMQNMMEKLAQQAVSLYPADELIADMGALYQKHLSRTDVDGMVAFFSSPAGQHMIDTIPAIMQEFMPMVMRKTQERMKPLIAEMSKQAADIANSAPTAKDKSPQK